MIRLLHTGDLHIGRLMGRRHRLNEQAAVLEEIVEIAVRDAVDVILVAGDVFEHRFPTQQAEQVLFDFLGKATARGLQVALITGNHDAPIRWGAHAGFLSRAQVHVFNTSGVHRLLIGADRRPLDLAVLPWVPGHGLLTSATLVEGKGAAVYADTVAAQLARLGAQAQPDAPLVLMAHVLVDQALVGGGENRLSMSQIYGIQPESLPAQANYVALGHVHRPQSVGKGGVLARYCGSPLQLDFGETSWTPSVVRIDLEAVDLPAQVRVVNLTRGKRLAVVRGTAEEVLAQAGAFQDYHVQLRIRQAEPLTPAARQELMAAFGSVIDIQHQRISASALSAAGAAAVPSTAGGEERTLWDALRAYGDTLGRQHTKLPLQLLDDRTGALLEQLRQDLRAEATPDSIEAAAPVASVLSSQ